MQEEITLCEQINDSEVEKTIIFCDVESITQSEFEAVGQKDIKPQYKFLRELEQHRWQCELEHCARSFLSNYGRLTKCPGNSYTAGG